jgi:hypothetical protein
MKYEHQISPTPKIIGAIAATKFQNVVHGREAPSISFPQA